MARKLRIQYPGATYHIMNRGDRREEIFRDDLDQRCFLETMEEVCAKTTFQVHAFCLMHNHFHAVIETPNANLIEGMKWLLWWTRTLRSSQAGGITARNCTTAPKPTRLRNMTISLTDTFYEPHPTYRLTSSTRYLMNEQQLWIFPA